jgi:hypothetical protein
VIVRASISSILAVCLVCVSDGEVAGQGEWEFLGPGVGYRPVAFFVSQHAIYVGLSEEDDTGIGLYRYRFDEGQWELFAWEGYEVRGITVWGDSDENILLIRFDQGEFHSDVLRSTDGGQSWVVTYEADHWLTGLCQAPSDTSRIIMHTPTLFSTDGGWSWAWSGGYFPYGGVWDVCFDPSDALVAYLAGQNDHEDDVIFKSTTGGAYWSLSSYEACEGIAVDHSETNHVMGASGWHLINVTTDAGENWSRPDAPLRTKGVLQPPGLPGSFYVLGSDLGETVFDVWRTGDLGQTWFRCGEGLPELPETPLWFMIVHLDGHPSEPTLYAALEGSGVWRWDAATSRMPDATEGSDPGIQLLACPVPSSNRFLYGIRLMNRERVLLRLYDASGRFVRTLREGNFPAGTHFFESDDARTDQSFLKTGVYYLRMDAGETEMTRKIVLLK